ncbi:MAG: hypothetical protein J5545_11295 [Bacteroidaceae bacterium]|nr:hypothetical protein [Bacteroidaceae bacterium]
MAKLTTEEFIKKAREVHGEKYDYSKVEYVDNKTKVCIICKKHGEFSQQASNHLRGIGCPRCGIEKRRAKRTHSVDEFLKSAKAIHGDKYDYSKVEYVNTKTKVCILCPVHGVFWQSPQKHLSGQGCEKCFRESIAKRYSMGRDIFIEKATVVHNGFYDYSEVEYVNGHTKVKIICPLHGPFLQDPLSHLAGHGCKKCADIENERKCRKWTSESCYEEARKYKTKVEFQKRNASAFGYAWKNGLLNTFDWFEEIKKPNGYWTKERCEEEARKYLTKGEFLEGCGAAHNAAVRNGWLDDYDWLIDQRMDIIKDKIDSVYVYIFEDTKAAYVGRTLIRRQKKRDREHIFNLDNDNVARYAKKHHVPVPPMIILESNLTLEEGLDREDFWRKRYEDHGYTMLNRLATGIGKGSLGGISHGKWNRKTCFEEARKYHSASEFRKANGSAYDASRRNGWIKDYSWFDVLWEPKWDKDSCYKEAKKYKTRAEFHRGSAGAYKKALENGWIEEYDWMPSRQRKPMGYWNNYAHCYEEAKKYKNRRKFQKGCVSGYNHALKNEWLNDYVWFEEKHKHNYWDRETCYEEAKKYHSRSEFEKHAVRAYELALANGWLDDYTWFEKLTNYWTYETCKVEAVKYEKRSHFKAAQPGAYTKSRVNGWLDDFFPKNK